MKPVYFLIVLLSQATMGSLVASPAVPFPQQGFRASASTFGNYDDWPAGRQTSTAGTKTGGKSDNDYKVGGNNYGGEDKVENDYGSTWSQQDAANFLFREGLNYDSFHDDFTYTECAQAEFVNSFNCYVESKHVRPYYVDLTYHPDENVLEFEFVRYASET